MTVQSISKSEQKRYGEFAVRVVCDTVISPNHDTMERLQSALPFEAKIATAAPDNGYGRTAYVLCENEGQKRRTKQALQ